MRFEVREIPPSLADTFWPLVEPLLEKALQVHPHLDIDGLRDLVLTGMAELVVAVNEERIIGAVAMETQRYPTKMVGNIIALGTETGVWKAHGIAITQALEKWCKTRNLGTLHMLGRAGWSRFVVRHGWRTQPSLVAWKELT